MKTKIEKWYKAHHPEVWDEALILYDIEYDHMLLNTALRIVNQVINDYYWQEESE